MEIVAEKLSSVNRPKFSENDKPNRAMVEITIADIKNETKDQLEEIKNPTHFNLMQKGKIFLGKTMRLLVGYLNPKLEDKEPVDRIEKLKPCEAKIILMGGIKYGVYRDEKKLIHIVSTECTHLECIITWNPDEKSWDCPCRSSRFSYNGKVIGGVANTNLYYHKINGSDIFRA